MIGHTDEPASKRSKKNSKASRPACSLPQASQQDEEILTTERARQKQERDLRKNVGSVHQIALHLRAGRTLPNLLNLQRFSLLSPLSSMSSAGTHISPAVGFSALHQGEPVIILDSYKCRGKMWCDVAPIVAKTGPKQSTHKVLRTKVFSCQETSLHHVGIHYRVTVIRKNVPWLTQVNNDQDRHLAQEELISGQRLGAWKCAGPPLETLSSEQPGENRSDNTRQVQPKSAGAHSEANNHKIAPREAGKNTTKVVWQLPEPVVLDCRPWRCLTCKDRPPPTACDDQAPQSVHYYKPTPEDIRSVIPEALLFHRPKIGQIWLHPTFLLHLLRFLYETMSFRESRRKIVDVLLTHAVSAPASTHARNIRVLLAALPSAHQLATLAKAVFPSILAPRVQHLTALQAIYNGPGLRIDGHWKKAKTITVYEPGNRRKRRHPMTCLFAICGTDGSLLSPVRATRSESWEDISPLLRKVLHDLVVARTNASLPLQHALPAFVATDSYHKHQRLLAELCQSFGQELRIQSKANTPKGSPNRVADILDPQEAACTVIAGEPYHDVINARKCVSPKANDAIHFIHDHEQMLCRLSAKPQPQDVAEQTPAKPPAAMEVQDIIQACLRMRVAQFATFKATCDQVSLVKLRDFLACPHVRTHKDWWKKVCGADPPRPVLARLANAVGGRLHTCNGYWNYQDKRNFKKEVRRMSAWYRAGRQTTRPRKGLLRIRSFTALHVKGQKRVWNAKLAKHYQRLLMKTRVRGLMHWRRCALALHMAGIPVQSGTIPVERHWAAFKAYFPSAQKTLKQDTFNLLSDLAFLRFNWSHFNKPGLPTWTEKDVILAQRAGELLQWLHHSQGGQANPLIDEILGAWPKVQEGNKQPKNAGQAQV